MKRLYSLISFLVLLGMAPVYSQFTLGFADSNQITNIPTTAYYNDQATYFVWVKNFSSSSTYQGTIWLYTSVDSGNGADTVQIDTFSVVIPPNDSLPLVLNEVYTPNDYRIGGNIVVIWPQAMNANWLNGSTLPYPVYILGYSSVAETDEESKRIYPVPCSNSLTIRIPPGKEKPEHVMILSADGRVLLEAPFSATLYLDPEWSPGTYILELRYHSGKREHLRVVKAQ
ncbi:MAG: T9SS type A sorting domain-containing protein [Bacteroidia bacterium]|nr:T9SS type A sorting domain-containing protein [Bacteroidia bacterium]